MSYTQKLLKQSAEIVKKEIKSKVYLAFDLAPDYTYENGLHHYRLPNGEYHRLDGPAKYGKGRDEYFIDGQEYRPADFWRKMKNTKYSSRIMANVLGSRNYNKKD
jgi:hypothetical protein